MDRVVRRIETYAYSYQILQETPALTDTKIIFDSYQDSTENRIGKTDKLRGVSDSSTALQPTMGSGIKIEKTDKLKGISDSPMCQQPTMNDVLAGIEPQEVT